MGAGLTILLVCGFLIIVLTMTYNRLVGLRVEVKNAWSQIDIQLKRRHELIPNLVETVKGYAQHEQGTLEKVIQARNSAISASGDNNIKDRLQAESQLTGALKQIFALSESYPDLKANQNFGALQEEISSTENRIAFARQHYNDSVAVYNASTEQIPGNLVKGFGNFSPAEMWEMGAEERGAVANPPQVKF